MRKMNLQLFAEAIQGKKLVYLYRIKKDAAAEGGTLLAFTTENGRTKSKETETTATKDGSIRTPGTTEVDVYKRQDPLYIDPPNCIPQYSRRRW